MNRESREQRDDDLVVFLCVSSSRRREMLDCGWWGVRGVLIWEEGLRNGEDVFVTKEQ